MTGILAEFVGGPLDGERHQLPEPLPIWRVPAKPVLSAFEREDPQEFLLQREFTYRRDEKLAEGAGPQRQPIWRYRLAEGEGVPR